MSTNTLNKLLKEAESLRHENNTPNEIQSTSPDNFISVNNKMQILSDRLNSPENDKYIQNSQNKKRITLRQYLNQQMKDKK